MRCAVRGPARLAAILSMALLGSGCATARYLPVPSPEAASGFYSPSSEDDYRIEVGDTLEIRSYVDPQLTQTVVVRPDGRISALVLDYLTAAGLTAAELAQVISEGYGSLADFSKVAVQLRQPSGQTAYVDGEVNLPSAQPLNGPLTVLGAIQQAGGLRPTAGAGAVLLRRLEGGDVQAFAIDLEEVLANRSPDIYLKPHDVVYVHKTTIAQVDLLFEQYVRNMIPDAAFLVITFYFGPLTIPFL